MDEVSYYAVIPGYIMEADIEPMAKFLFAAISRLTKKEGFCWASNESLAEQLKTSDRTIRRWLNSLAEIGAIYIKTDGRNRKIFLTEATIGKADKNVQVDNSVQEGGQKCPANPDKNVHQIYKENNKIIKKDSTHAKALDNSEEFEDFWKQFPKQRIGSKPEAWRRWITTLQKNEVTASDLIAICLSYSQSDEVQRGFSKGCAAWLHDERWRNDYSTKHQGNQNGNDPRRIGNETPGSWNGRYTGAIGSPSIHQGSRAASDYRKKVLADKVREREARRNTDMAQGLDAK